MTDQYEDAQLGWPPRSCKVKHLIGRGYGKGLAGCIEDLDTQAVVYKSIEGDYIVFINGESLIGYGATAEWHVPIERVKELIKEYCGKWADKILQDLSSHL